MLRGKGYINDTEKSIYIFLSNFIAKIKASHSCDIRIYSCHCLRIFKILLVKHGEILSGFNKYFLV